jgi:hypothetical protein
VLVDGRPCTPDGAHAYVDDDFGGRNASLWVRGAASSETLTCRP